MAAKVILTQRPNSHSFETRSILLTDVIKVGRSVARAKPSPNNSIFDCKVLSRNHAKMWYENGKFFVQDTKSSNGTFVNNQRLSKGTEESAPREVFSGDIIQFGVDVLENQKQVTHGCITTCVTLFHPDGQEAKPTIANNGIAPCLNSGLQVPTQDLYLLHQYLEEASHREHNLEAKLAALQRLVEDTNNASNDSWQALIAEDRMLSRLETLEAQLTCFAKNQSEDNLKQEIILLNDEKSLYQESTKEGLKEFFEENVTLSNKLNEVERCFGSAEDECEHLRQQTDQTQKELQELATKNSGLLQDLSECRVKLQEEERKTDELRSLMEEERRAAISQVEQMERVEEALQNKVEFLVSENEIQRQKICDLQHPISFSKNDSRDEDEDLDRVIICEDDDEDAFSATPILIQALISDLTNADNIIINSEEGLVPEEIVNVIRRSIDCAQQLRDTIGSSRGGSLRDRDDVSVLKQQLIMSEKALDEMRQQVKLLTETLNDKMQAITESKEISTVRTPDSQSPEFNERLKQVECERDSLEASFKHLMLTTDTRRLQMTHLLSQLETIFSNLRVYLPSDIVDQLSSALKETSAMRDQMSVYTTPDSENHPNISFQVSRCVDEGTTILTALPVMVVILAIICAVLRGFI